MINTPSPTDEPAHDLEVDARGLNCPLPILKAKKGLASLTSGQVVKVLATDLNSERDFQDFARQTGNTLLLQSREGPVITHWLARR
jgi:tRNA 2-thiouridine synthesizing protein A